MSAKKKDGKKAKHIYSQEEISRVRNLAEGMDDRSNLGILLRAIVAGLSGKKEDFRIFLDLAFESPPHSLKAEAMMVLISLLLGSGNFNEARQLAADLHSMEHHVLHALARVRIAKFSGDEEDGNLAAEVMRELLESYTAEHKSG
jgi:hypothetical protein